MPTYQFIGSPNDIVAFQTGVVLSASNPVVNTIYVLEAQPQWDPTKVTRTADSPHELIAVYNQSGTVSSIPSPQTIDHTIVPDLSKCNTLQFTITNGGIVKIYLNDNTDPNKAFVVSGNDTIKIKFKEYTLDKVILEVVNAAGNYSLNIWLDGDIRDR